MRQIDYVRERLLTDGHITRNQALSRYITRLASRIKDVEKEGLKIKGENLKTENGTDYIYRLVKPEQGRLL